MRMERRTISSPSSDIGISARAAAGAEFPPEPIPVAEPNSSSSGSSTSPEPDRVKPVLLSATMSIASRRRRYRSVRQSLASSTQARASWPGYCSSFASSRSNSVKASAVAPAKPAMTSPLARRRTLRALDLTTVWPMLTWPSPPMTTVPPLRTIRMVVACHPGERRVSSVIAQSLSLWASAGCMGASAVAQGRMGRSERRWRLNRTALIEGVDPDRVGPGAPPRDVNGDDTEPFRLWGVAPSPFRDFGKFDRRLREPASDPAQRGRGAGDERDGVDGRALTPHFVVRNLDVVNPRALA